MMMKSLQPNSLLIFKSAQHKIRPKSGGRVRTSEVFVAKN